MATYVNDLRLKEIATGDESGTWGTSTNTNLELIGEAVSYATQESFSSDANVTTTVADGAADPARAFYFKVTSSGSLTATRVLTIAPNTMSRVQIIENATSGSQIITIKQGSGATVNIPNGETRMVYMDGAGSGAAVVDALADINIGGKLTVGVDDTGYDVTLFGATSGQKVFWDESADTLYQTCTVDIDGTVTVGVDDTGYDVKFFGATSGAYMLWDESADDLVLAGAAGLDIAGDIDVDGTANLDVVDIDGAVDMASTLTVAGVLTGASLDISGDIDIDGTANLDVVDIDGAVDMASTLTLAGNADFNGALDVDGTTNLDAVDIDGAVQADGTITVGVNDTGYDVKFFGATSGAYMLWDESADDLKLVGAAGLTVAGDADIDGTTNLDAVDIDGAVQLDSTFTVGVDDTGYDVKLFGATASKYMLWDESADSLIVKDVVDAVNFKVNGGQGSDGQVLTSTGSGVAWEAAAGGTTLSGSTNNTITTVTGANAIQGEANLTFDGTRLIAAGGTGSEMTTSNIRVTGYSSGVEWVDKDDVQNWYWAIDDNESNAFIMGMGYGPGQGIEPLMWARVGSGGSVGSLGIAGEPETGHKLDVFGVGRISDGVLFGTDTAAANTLDDYEEGTWTPSFATGSGSITVNASDSRAYYTKVGRAVHWMTRMVVSAISSPSGTLHINGLPFTSFNPGGDSNTCQAGQFMENVNSSNIGEDIIGLVPNNTTYCNLRQSGTTGAGNDLANKVDTGTYLLLAGTYFTAT